MLELLGLLAVGLPILLIVLLVMAIRHSGSIAQIQSRLQSIEARLTRLEATPRPREETVIDRLRDEAAAAMTRAPVVETAPIAPAPAEPPPPQAGAAETDAPTAAGEAPVEPVETPAEPPEPPEEPEEPPEEPEEPRPVPGSMPPPPGPRFDWERFIGLRLPVWLGAIALSVAGFFFVSYAIESGFFTPEMRVLSAAAAAVAFLAGAEFVRRRVTTSNAAAIASALTAAAIATAYATAYLATQTYGLVPSGAGFIITIGVSIAAIAIALTYGEAVALIGIVGGYVAPAIYGGGEANAPFLVIYLTALTAVTYAVIRFKGWWRLSIVGLIGPAFWAMVWETTWPLRQEYFWGNTLLIALPVIVAIASWSGWREDGPVIGVRGFTAMRTPERGSLVAATILAAIAFVVFISGSQHAIGYWQGLIVFAAGAIALGFVSPAHRALQLPILIAAGVTLVLWRDPDPTAGYIVTSLLALVFGFGALDQFRRLREPALWAAVLAVIAVFGFGIALFKVEGWSSAIADRHWWALGALALAGGFVVLLRVFAGQIEDELARSQVYAAWGGAVTTLVSLAVVLELDPLYFPAAAALAILGLAAVHLRVPVRGLRVVAGLYLAIYLMLLFGALIYADSFGSPPGYWSYVLVRDPADHALALLVIPGLALLAAGTMFQRSRPEESRELVAALDIVAIAAEVAGLFFLLAWPYSASRWSDTLSLAARIAGPQLAVAAAAVYVGRRFGRHAAYAGGILLTGVMVLGMLAALILPLLQFWPPFAVPGTVVVNITLVAYGIPALLLYFIGWYLRQETRQGVRIYGIGVSIFAVIVTYAMLMIDIRHAYHLGSPTLQGDMSQPEYYAYSIGTLLFGLALLIGGVAFRHRGARAVSFFFVLAATIKVFLFDASELEGLWRVLSFLLMGLSFLGISWGYARFVFGIGTKKPADSEVTAQRD
jgi:hypothetical protein